MIALSRKYDWDFDNYLEEDVPAAVKYILTPLILDSRYSNSVAGPISFTTMSSLIA
jgi:hypothetical protein